MKFVNPEDKTAHDLPPMTLALQELADSTDKSAGRELYQTELEFLRETLGGEYVAGALGEDVEAVDLVALSLLYMRVLRAYTEPIEREQARQVAEQMKAVRPVMEAAKVAEQFGGRQVFARAK